MLRQGGRTPALPRSREDGPPRAGYFFAWHANILDEKLIGWRAIRADLHPVLFPMSLKTLAALALSFMLLACGGQDPVRAGIPALSVSITTKHSSREITRADYYPLVQRLYVSYFGRPADPAGLDFYAGHYLLAGADLHPGSLDQAYLNDPFIRMLIDSFGTSKESNDLYPGDNATFIGAIYANLFNRLPDEGGKAFWIAALDSGAVNRAAAALAIMNGAQGSDADIIASKVSAASAFTSALNLPSRRAVYSGKAANSVVRAMLARVGQRVDIKAFASEAELTINQLLAASQLFVIDSVTPETAQVGKLLELTVTGINMLFQTQLNVASCTGMTEIPGGHLLERRFTCTPTIAGAMAVTVTDIEGMQAAEFTLRVVDANYVAPTVSAVSPDVATLGSQTLFTVTGTHLLGKVRMEVADCVSDNIEIAGATDSQWQYACKPTSGGKKTATVFGMMGEVLYTFTVNVSDI